MRSIYSHSLTFSSLNPQGLAHILSNCNSRASLYHADKAYIAHLTGLYHIFHIRKNYNKNHSQYMRKKYYKMDSKNISINYLKIETTSLLCTCNETSLDHII